MAQPGLQRLDSLDERPYYADAVFGDFNNDGWLDLVVPDRRERPDIEVRSMLFMNRGDGTFEPKPATFSGLYSSAINAEAADIDGDGLLDVVFAADPDNSNWANRLSQYESKIYRNTGRYGGRENHWLRARFSGVPDAVLMGARVEARAPGTGTLLGTRTVASKQSYKSGSPLEVHFGLGRQSQIDVHVFLLDGNTVFFRSLRADQFLDLNLATGRTMMVHAE